MYKIKDNLIVFSRTNPSVSKVTFNEALKEVPLKNIVPLQNLQVPSYSCAILMDKRIRVDYW